MDGRATERDIGSITGSLPFPAVHTLHQPIGVTRPPQPFASGALLASAGPAHTLRLQMPLRPTPGS